MRDVKRPLFVPKMASLSKRVQDIPASPIRKLLDSARQAEKQGKKVYYLNIGQPDLPTPADALARIKNYPGKILKYEPSQGTEEAIGAWQDYFKNNNISFLPDELIVTTGGSEAILFALAAVADPGDEILLFDPTYYSYIADANILSLRVVPIPLSIENGFHLPDSDQEITKHISSKTKAIVVCTPNNPTGTVFTKEELARLAKIAKEHDLLIISDETYREIVFNKKQHISMMDFPEVAEQVVLVDSISKRFNACGARIGCLASKNKEIIKGVIKMAQSRLASPTIEQYAFLPPLKDSKKYTAGLVEEYTQRKRAVCQGLEQIPGARFNDPEGAFYLIAKLPVNDADKFCQWLVSEFDDQGESVLFAPAAGFYATPGLGKQEIRIAYVLAAEKMTRAMEILKKAIAAYNKD